jgi:hypothetical protein
MTYTKTKITLCLLLLSACNTIATKKENSKSLHGVYKLISLQTQEDTIFAPMEGIDILKFYSDSQWISPAYLSINNKVVNLAGGTYSYDGNEHYIETLNYHSKDTVNMGLATSYRLVLKNDTLYQSGVFKPGTPEQWKVEEYWIKIE